MADERTPERKRQDAAWLDRHRVPVTDAKTTTNTKITDSPHGKVKTTETRNK